MRYLYMDESGDAGLPNKHSSPTRFMVYSGVALTPVENFEIKAGIHRILKRNFRGKSFDAPDELRYNDIVRERGPFGKLSGKERKALCDDVFDLITDVEPTLIATVIDKKRHERKYIDPISPKEYAFRCNVERFHYFLDDNDEFGSVVIDESENFVDHRLQKLVYEATDDGISLVGKGTKIPRLMDSAMTTPSEMSPGVQIADFVAYVTRCHFERSQSRRFNQISHLWRDPIGTSFTEPSLLPGGT